MDIPRDLQGKELFKFLKTNKEDLIYAKKNIIKHADGLSVATNTLNPGLSTNKNDGDDSKTEVKVRAIINTTNVIDSHKDVHLDGIWTKSIQENKNLKFLQEHVMSFKTIIADKSDLDVSVQSVTWKSLGYDFEGKTEALTFDAVVKQERNPFMFKEYRNKNVDNHSVGMHYVKMDLAINSDEEDYAEEKSIWDKYIGKVVNRSEAEKSNYFWAVSEAKAIEGSAVVMGSNGFTPTVASKENNEPNPVENKNIEAIKSFLNIKD
tara:strand:- start:9266 stop:10057 length:792 start_codon:yes stop_codon:yes gene_type:complete